jgi:hypothetical protein
MEKPHDLPSFRIHPRDVRTFVAIAADATEGEVFLIGKPTVLARDDVIYDVFQRRKRLRQQAVFTPFRGSTANRLFEEFVHAPLASRSGVLPAQRRFGLRFEDRKPVVDVQIIVELG